MQATDILMVGGGVIGLAIARDLAAHGGRVMLVERGEIGREASWAGAGILPPASAAHAVHPYDQLRALSSELHPRLAAELLEETGIDNGYRRCGGIYVAGTAGEAAALRGMYDAWQDEGVRIDRLDAQQLAQLEPALAEAFDRQRIRAAYHVPEECQLRNPRHLKALQRSCELRNVQLVEGCEVLEFQSTNGRVVTAVTTRGPIHCEKVCITSGPWTAQLLTALGIENGIFPVRGQIVLFAGSRPVLSHVISEGSRYLVPRDDGRLLAGSTEEEAGFSKQTTAAGIAELTSFAQQLVPALRAAPIERTWAGLRPATLDGFPYFGRVPAYENLFVAAGHFRQGLYLSPATAVTMSQLIRDERPLIDLTPFGVLRG